MYRSRRAANESRYFGKLSPRPTATSADVSEQQSEAWTALEPALRIDQTPSYHLLQSSDDDDPGPSCQSRVWMAARSPIKLDCLNCGRWDSQKCAGCAKLAAYIHPRLCIGVKDAAFEWRQSGSSKLPTTTNRKNIFAEQASGLSAQVPEMAETSRYGGARYFHSSCQMLLHRLNTWIHFCVIKITFHIRL